MAEDKGKTHRPERLVNLNPTKPFGPKDQDRKWVLVDAKGQSLGRISTVIASMLRGKHRPTFTPHDDAGDFVVVINAKEVELRGNNKVAKKMYYKHTGYMGNLKERTATEMLAKSPDKLIQLAVGGMLPRGPLGNRMLRKLKVYAGPEHPHKAQAPEPFVIETRKAS